MNKNEKYWVCIIGPAKENELKSGADAPLRNAVQNAYNKMIHNNDFTCWSGWGCSKERVDLLNAVWSMEEDDSLFLAIKEMLKSRIESNFPITTLN